MKSLKTIAFLSIIGGVLAHLAVFTVIRIQGPAQPEPYPDPAPIRFLGNFDQLAAPAILEQAALFDSAPLFMPTRWNRVSQMSEVASLREATEIFPPFPEDLLLSRFEPSPPAASAELGPRPLDLLPDGPGFILSSLGRKPTLTVPASSPGPAIRLQRLDREVSGLPAERLPRALGDLAPSALWSPTRFHVLISEGMPVGPPFLTRSSGFPDWDVTLYRFIGSLEFYRSLDDGYYLLTVFP